MPVTENGRNWGGGVGGWSWLEGRSYGCGKEEDALLLGVIIGKVL